jgi:anthranilate phosphoribosyltransferase
MFAPLHHAATKRVAMVRRDLGVRTIFNLLGPLTNPGRAKHQLLGVFARELTDRLAAVLRELGSERAWVVHAEDGLDELSTIGPTRVSELKHGHVTTWTLDPRSIGLSYARLSDLQVDTVEQAARELKQVLAGEQGPKRDIALLNAAAALVIAGSVHDLTHGLAEAADAIDSGRAAATLEALVRLSAGNGG